MQSAWLSSLVDQAHAAVGGYSEWSDLAHARTSLISDSAWDVCFPFRNRCAHRCLLANSENNIP